MKKDDVTLDKIILSLNIDTYAYKDKLYVLSYDPYTKFSRYTLFTIKEVIVNNNKFEFNSNWMMKIYIGDKNYKDIIQNDSIKEDNVSLFVNYKIDNNGILNIEYAENKFLKVDLKNRNIQDIADEIERFYKSFKYVNQYRKFKYEYSKEVPLWFENRYVKIGKECR